MMNQLKTLVLLSSLTGLLLWAGRAAGGEAGLAFALVGASLMNLGAWWFSDRLVLAMHRARRVGPAEEPALHAAVSRLAAKAGLPMPSLYVIDEEAPNAFATGRGPARSAVAVTTGLLALLGARELDGVLAHELAHIRNRDTLTMAVAATLGGAISMLGRLAWFRGSNEEDSNPLAVMIAAPIAAMLIQLAVSRSREYLADATAAEVTGEPRALARALRKLEAWNKRIPMAEAQPALAHLYIVSPLKGLFSTHPPIEERARRLEAMGL